MSEEQISASFWQPRGTVTQDEQVIVLALNVKEGINYVMTAHFTEGHWYVDDDLSDDPDIKWKVLGWIPIPRELKTLSGEYFFMDGLGEQAFSTQLPRQINSAKEIIGETYLINGEPRKIKDVELFMHAAPWLEGERCCFLFE